MSLSCRLFCKHCRCERHFRKPAIDHGTHLLLTALSLGVWSLGWAAICVHHRYVRRWRCRCCGRRARGAEALPMGGVVGLEGGERVC